MSAFLRLFTSHPLKFAMARARNPSRRALHAAAQTQVRVPTIETPAEEEATNTNIDPENDDEAAESQESVPVPTQSQVSRRAGSYTWTGQAHLFLISELKAAIRDGERAETGFHKRVWDRIAQGFPAEGLAPVTKQQLKNKVDAVRPEVDINI